ncbi:hypothetical protein BJX99DRAFT_240897 [Aspergillus californicus]
MLFFLSLSSIFYAFSIWYDSTKLTLFFTAVLRTRCSHASHAWAETAFITNKRMPLFRCTPDSSALLQIPRVKSR